MNVSNVLNVRRMRRRWFMRKRKVPPSLLVKLMAIASYSEIAIDTTADAALRRVAQEELATWLKDPEVVKCLRPEIREQAVRDGVQRMPEPSGGPAEDAGSSQAA